MIHCQEEMLQLVLEVGRAYQPLKPETILDNPTQNSFYLKYGAINIPYKHQESTYARFEGHPLSLKLEIEMTDTHKKAEGSALDIRQFRQGRSV
jgi:hypothetical protein